MQRTCDRINLGLILRMPRDRLDVVLEEIARLPDVFVVHRQPSYMKLYITEKPPGFSQEAARID